MTGQDSRPSPAVILAVNNNPMRFSDRSGGVCRRRVILHFPEQIAPKERDPQLKNKIARELAVIVRQLMQKFSDPMTAPPAPVTAELRRGAQHQARRRPGI
ncbi:hypothetical protein NGUA13_00652 [Salmonella enterica]|nr:hypothetical protein NGUA13_00652 [Salmonella enterica]